MIPAVIKIGGLEISVEDSNSLASNRDRFGEYSKKRATKKPRGSARLLAFKMVGATGFEPATF